MKADSKEDGGRGLQDLGGESFGKSMKDEAEKTSDWLWQQSREAEWGSIPHFAQMDGDVLAKAMSCFLEQEMR